MQANHENGRNGSDGTYTEAHHGYPLILQFRETGPEREVRAIWLGPVTWETPWGRSWITQLEHCRALVDRYLRALAFCGLALDRRRQSLAVGAIELVPTFPAVRS
jgi:hypothetical protein